MEEKGFGFLKCGTISVPNSREEIKLYKEASGWSETRFLVVKRGDDIGRFLDLIRELDLDFTEDGFYMKDADEMLLVYQFFVIKPENTKLLGKIEFSKNGAYMNWLHATPGNGVFCFNCFQANVLEKRKINKTQFILSIDPTESKKTVLGRLNFYVRKIEVKVAIIDVIFKKETGAVQLVCEIGLK